MLGGVLGEFAAVVAGCLDGLGDGTGLPRTDPVRVPGKVQLSCVH